MRQCKYVRQISRATVVEMRERGKTGGRGDDRM